MNLNVYINDALAKQLDIIAVTSHKKRNTLIQDAISMLVQNYTQTKWPNSILKFHGINEFDKWEGFEQTRKELKEPNSDIFKGI